MSITKMRTSFAHVMKPILIFIALVFVAGVFFVFGGGPTGGSRQGQSPKDVIAIANGREITMADFGPIFDNMMRQYNRYSTTATQIASMKLQVLNDLINRNIMVAAAEKAGISIGWLERRRERAKIVDDQIEQARKYFGGNRKKPLSDKELDLNLAKQDPPTSIKKLRSDTEAQVTDEQLMVQKLIAKVQSSVGNIDDARLRDNYRTLRVRQIVIKPNGLPEAQTRDRADRILKELRSGADFAALAAKYSDDDRTKGKGGDVGYEKVSEDPDLKGLKVGQTSPIIKSAVYPGDLRIVKIEGGKLDLPADFDKNKAKYRAELKTQLQSQASQEMFRKIQNEARIQVKDPELKGYWLADKARSATDPAEKNRLEKQAIASLVKATGQDPGRAEPFTQLVQLYVMQGQPKKAIGVLDDILDKRKITEGADLRLQLAQLYLQTEQPEKARPQLDIARDMAYDQPQVHYQLAGLYKDIGAKEDAEKEQAWLLQYSAQMRAAQGRDRAAPTPATNP